MKILINNIIRRNSLLTIGVTFSFISVIYYSYLPFLFVINAIQIEKNSIFIIIALITLCFSLLHLFPSAKRCNKYYLTVIGLYILFAIYSLISFLLTPSHLDSFITLRTFCVINPMFILYALLCRNKKQYFLKLIYLASLSYFIFAVYRFLSGRLLISSQGFQDIFGVTETVPYQNINLFLGIFVVLTLVKSRHCETILIKICLYILAISALGVMIVIGGRAPLFASFVIIMVFYFLEYRYNTILGTLKSIYILLAASIILFIFSEPLIIGLMGTVSFRRVSILFNGGDPSFRLFLFSNAITLFLLDIKNIFLGAGMNYFPVYIGADSLSKYPHNVILELLSEYGILGTLLFFSPIAYTILLRISKMGTVYGRNTTEKSIFLLVLYFWAINMVTGGLRTSWVLIFYTFLLFPATPKPPGEEHLSLKI